MLADHIGVPQLRDMASRSEQIVDKVGVRGMSRVGELLHSAYDGGGQVAPGKLDVEIGFHGGLQGFPEISVKLDGTLGIICQRCLGLLSWPVDLNFQLVVVESETDLEDIAEPFDAVVAGEHGVQLVAVIEDELLASMPIAPVHDNVADCSETSELANSDLEAEEGTDLNRPFAALGELLADRQKQDPEGKDG